jgi:hypothetical protein
MTTKVGPLIFVSLAMVGITVVSITHAQAPRESYQAEVMALNQRSHRRIQQQRCKRDYGLLLG